MKPPQTFGKALTGLIRKNRLSIAALGERVGGKALLKRAMQDELPETRRDAMYGKLCELKAFSDDELNELQNGLEVSRIGVREFLTKNALLRLMSDDSLLREETITNKDFLARLQAAGSADEANVLCVNCCYPSLFNALSKCFVNVESNITMRHYVSLGRDGCDAASLVYCATPLMGDPRYLPYSIPKEAELQCIDGDFCVICTQKGGKLSEFAFIMKSDDEIYMLPYSSQTRLISFLEDLLSGVSPRPVAIKELNAPGISYVDVMVRYLALELNRATYTISADFAYMQIPPDLVATALDEQALRNMGLSDAELMRIKTIIPRRYQNFYTKKKPGLQISSIHGIKSFLETGNTRGSFGGFRTFTPKERVRILSDMLEKLQSNAYYRLYLFKDERYQVKYTTICFDKLGVSVLPRMTVERARAGFNHMFLTIPEFTQHFISHYKRQMVDKYCYNEADSYDILKKLVDEYAAQVLR